MTRYIRQVNGLIGLINITSFLKLFNWEDEKIMLIFTLLSYILHFSHGPFLIKYWWWWLLFFKALQLDCSCLPVSGGFLSLFPFSTHLFFFLYKHNVRSIEFLPEKPLWMFYLMTKKPAEPESPKPFLSHGADPPVLSHSWIHHAWIKAAIETRWVFFSCWLWQSLWDTGKACVGWVDAALCWQQGKRAGNREFPLKLLSKIKCFHNFFA